MQYEHFLQLSFFLSSFYKETMQFSIKKKRERRKADDNSLVRGVERINYCSFWREGVQASKLLVLMMMSTHYFVPYILQE